MTFPLADVGFAVTNLVHSIISIISLLIVLYVLLDLARNFMRDMPQALLSFHRALASVFEPVFRPIRNALPDLGGLDLSPLLVLLGLQFINNVIV